MNTLLPVIPDADDSSLPLPLIVAQKWNFPLAYVQKDESLYAVQDWIHGLIGGENANQALRNLRRTKQTVFSKHTLPYIATDGKTYQRDFTDDKGLYLIAQQLRTTKARPMLAAIKTYLSESGAFVDLVRREPNTMITSGAMNPDQAIDAAIAAYRAQGKDDRWIMARLEGKIKRGQFTAALSAAVNDVLTPRHYAAATDDIYKGLWGRTAAYLKHELELPKNTSLRDHQPMLALHYQGIAEEVSARKLGEQQELSWHQAREIVQKLAEFVGRQAQETSDLLSMDLATGKPLLISGK
jgi:hypothetical protein